MSEFLPQSNPEFEESEPKLDRNLVVGRLRELGVEEDLEYLLDESTLDDNDLMGEIVMLATMYDLDIDEVLRETTPIEHRARNDHGVTLKEIYGEDQ